MRSPESPTGTEVKPPAVPLIVFGEVLFDCFPDGRRVLGGAPFNVAWGLKGFGRDPLFISAVGNDADGAKIRERMQDWGMRLEGLQTDPDHASGEVEVMIKDDEPSYEICEPRAWDFVEDAGQSSDGIIYHGLLALRNKKSCESFEALVDRSSAQRFFDVNLRPPFDSKELLREWAREADWLKLNIEELEVILGENKIDFTRSEDAIQRLREDFNIRNVLLTGGSQGARIFGNFGRGACLPAPEPASLVDTVGAGDSFSAVTIDGILSGMAADEIVERASRFAAKVCGMRGATSEDKDFYNLNDHG